MTQLVCDTNFLMKITGQALPSFSDFISKNHFEIATVSSVVRELSGLKRNEKKSVRRRAESCLNLIGVKIQIRESELAKERIEADIELFELAKYLEDGSYVATLDGKLLSKFERNKLPYLTLRNDRPFLRSSNRATYLSTKKE